MTHLSNYIDEEAEELRRAVEVDGLRSGLGLDLYFWLVRVGSYPTGLEILGR